MPWAKGQSGNPAGRTKSAARLTEFARTHCEKAIRLCVKYLKDENAEPKLRLQAAGMILDRGLGKAAQGVTAAQLTDEELVQELAIRRKVRDAESERVGSGSDDSH